MKEKGNGKNPADSLILRQAIIKDIDSQGLIATPASSKINELVTEAARLSIQNDGSYVKIMYGSNPRVELRKK